MDIKLKIEGMMCPQCEARCKKALEAVAGVEKAEVSHQEGSALVTGTDLDTAALKAAVEEAGYKVLARNNKKDASDASFLLSGFFLLGLFFGEVLVDLLEYGFHVQPVHGTGIFQALADGRGAADTVHAALHENIGDTNHMSTSV